MPTFNQAEYISAAIESVLTQSYKSFELIIVDNYSTDNTSSVIKGFNDFRIKYLQFNNQGVIAAARNHGVKHAQGSVLAFLDSDDIWLPNMLSAQINLLSKDVSLVSSSFIPIGNVTICRHHLNDIIENDVKSFSYRDIALANPVMTSSVVLYKKVFEEVGGFDESPQFRFIEDWELWLRLAANANILVNGAKLLKYRISSKTDRDLRDVKKRTLLIMKKHHELNYLNERLYITLQGNCYVDIGKAHLDMNDREGIKFYFKGLWAANGIHNKSRAFAGILLFFTPLAIRTKLKLFLYKLNSTLLQRKFLK